MAKHFNPYSRCTCCDQALSTRQPILKSTGEVDDLCAPCRRVVSKAVRFHKEDLLDMEHDVWGIKMGGEEILDQYKGSEDYYDEDE